MSLSFVPIAHNVEASGVERNISFVLQLDHLPNLGISNFDHNKFGFTSDDNFGFTVFTNVASWFILFVGYLPTLRGQRL